MKVLMIIMIAISVCVIYDIRKIVSKNFSKKNNYLFIGSIRIIAMLVSLIASIVYYII